MNVVVVATSFPRFDGDHAGRFVLDLSRGLAELGHRLVHVVPGESGAVERETLDDGLEVRRAPYLRPRGLQSLAYGHGIGANVRSFPPRILAAPLLMRALSRESDRALGEARDAILLSHWLFPCGLVAADLARKRRRAHVAVAHGGGVELLRRMPFGRRLLGRVQRGTSRFVFVSRALEAKALALTRERAWSIASTIQPMGVDRGVFAAAPLRERDREYATLEVLAAGRLVPIKGFDLLIRAVGELRGVRLSLAGTGPEDTRLRRLARDCGADVRFLGQLAPDTLADAMRDADVVAVPSRLGRAGRSEGSPVVVAESFCVGRPVLASATGGLVDQVEDGVNGLIFEPESIAGLCAAIGRLAGDAALRARLSQGASASALRYDCREIARTFDRLLHDAARA